MSPRRRALLGAAFVVVAFLATRIGLWLLPSEADRLAEQVEALGRRVLVGDIEAVLEHVDLERFGLRAAAMGDERTFGSEDEDRLVAQAREAASWLPLEKASIDVVDCEIADGEDDRAAVAVRLSFTDDGERYADVFDLVLRKHEGRWFLTEVRLRVTRDSATLHGGLR